MSEKELDMNDLINDFNEYSTDYTKTACDYYENYLINYQKEKLDLQQENKQLKDRIEIAIEHIRDCCNMDSKWTNLHFSYAQNDMLSEQVDELLEILKGEKDEC